MTGSQIHTRGAAHPHAPLRKNIYEKSTWLRLNVVQFQLSSSSSFRDMTVSQVYTRGRCPPRAPSDEIFISEKSTWPRLNVVQFPLSSSSSFREMRVVPNLH